MFIRFDCFENLCLCLVKSEKRQESSLFIDMDYVNPFFCLINGNLESFNQNEIEAKKHERNSCSIDSRKEKQYFYLNHISNKQNHKKNKFINFLIYSLRFSFQN